MASVHCQEHLASHGLAATADAAHALGRGESCAVPWLHSSGERSEAHLTSTVFCPHCCCQAGGRALAVCLSHHWHWSEAEHQQSAYVPTLAMGQGVSRQSVIGHCLVATKTLQSGLLLFLAQMALFEPTVLSSSGIIISTDNIISNSSSLL